MYVLGLAYWRRVDAGLRYWYKVVSGFQAVVVWVIRPHPGPLPEGEGGL
jgi:hypothetical protein